MTRSWVPFHIDSPASCTGRGIRGLLLSLGLFCVGCAPSSAPIDMRVEASDGSSVEIWIDYRPDGCVELGETKDCYYYRVLLTPSGGFDPSRRVLEDARRAAERELDRRRELFGYAEEALQRGALLEEVESRLVDQFGYESIQGLEAAVEDAQRALVGPWCDKYAFLHLRIYDIDGFSLYRNPSGEPYNALSPGWNDVPDEALFVDGMWIWAGRFGIENLPPSQFERIARVDAHLERPLGCPDR